MTPVGEGDESLRAPCGDNLARDRGFQGTANGLRTIRTARFIKKTLMGFTIFYMVGRSCQFLP
jgi:hypothetical protein